MESVSFQVLYKMTSILEIALLHIMPPTIPPPCEQIVSIVLSYNFYKFIFIKITQRKYLIFFYKFIKKYNIIKSEIKKSEQH